MLSSCTCRDGSYIASAHLDKTSTQTHGSLRTRQAASASGSCRRRLGCQQTPGKKTWKSQQHRNGLLQWIIEMTVIGWYHVFFCVFFRFFGGVHSSNTLKFCQCFDGKKCVFQTLIRARLSGPLKIFSQLPNQQMHSHMLKAEALHTWCGWISSMSCSATSLATTEPCRKKRPHQWISISMPCVPLLPMLVLGTCPHPDSFCALKKKWKQEPSKHPVHFYQNVWQSETNLQLEIQETQSLQWAKTRNRAFNLRAKSKKKQKTHQYNSSFSSKDLLHFAKRNHPMSPKSH